MREPSMQMRVSRVAAYVAEGYSVEQAGRMLGLTKGQAAHAWREVKADMGWQAQ